MAVFLKRWTSRERSATSCFSSWFFRRGSSVVVLPLEVFDLLTGGVSHRVPGEPLFPRFHEFLGPGIEDARLDPLSSAEVTNGHFPAEPFQDDADLVLPGRTSYGSRI